MSRNHTLLLALLASGCGAFVDADKDGVAATIDCDDHDATVRGMTTWAADADDDGFVDASRLLQDCTAPDGFLRVDSPPDCDDTDASLTEPTAWNLDIDGDGFGGAAPVIVVCSPPEGATHDASDCDDTNDTVWPEAPELCDGLDNDCNGQVDDHVDEVTWYPDRDRDGFGDEDAQPLTSCIPPIDHADNNGDCDDFEPTVNPGITEVCDGIDNDCSGSVDDLPECRGDWWELGLQVTDAEYDPTLDVVVAVSIDAKALYVINPETRGVDTVSLPAPAHAVSVDLLGGEAAVLHDGWVSQVDLITGDTTTHATVSGVPWDLATYDGMAYVIPKNGQHTDVFSLDLLTGTETSVRGVRQGTRLKVHPYGDRLYGADNGVSPSDFERYNIGHDGRASYAYDSVYHGDYGFGGDLWIDEAGDYVFAQTGHVFRATNDKATDLTYAGTLTDVFGVRWVSTSEETDRVYAVHSEGPGQVNVYDLVHLDPKGTTILPTTDSGEPMDVRWVFASDTGDEVHFVGTYAVDGTERWSLLTMPAGTLK